MEKEYSGDFLQIDCEKCYRNFRVTIKDEELHQYYCPYCGHKMLDSIRVK